MRRYGHLWEKVISDDNIRLALHNACKSNGRTSSDKRAKIEYIRNHPEESMRDVKKILTGGNYRTGDYLVYILRDPKLRLIYALPFYPDRVIHHCLMNVLEPIWNGLMYRYSFACRKAYGHHKAGVLCAKLTKKYRYVLQGDIAQFYVSISHDILKRILRKKIKDTRILAMLDELIDSIDTKRTNMKILSHFDRAKDRKVDQALRKLERVKACWDEVSGVPIGNFPSQWFGNVYMNEFDTFVKQTLRARNYERYCDDFLIFSNSKAELNSYKPKITGYLYSNLHLNLSSMEVYPTAQGVDFCGYRYFHRGYVLLRKATARRLRGYCTEIENGLATSSMTLETAQNRLGSLKGVLKWAKTYNFREASHYNNLVREVNRKIKAKRTRDAEVC